MKIISNNFPLFQMEVLRRPNLILLVFETVIFIHPTGNSMIAAISFKAISIFKNVHYYDSSIAERNIVVNRHNEY